MGASGKVLKTTAKDVAGAITPKNLLQNSVRLKPPAFAAGAGKLAGKTLGQSRSLGRRIGGSTTSVRLRARPPNVKSNVTLKLGNADGPSMALKPIMKDPPNALKGAATSAAGTVVTGLGAATVVHVVNEATSDNGGVPTPPVPDSTDASGIIGIANAGGSAPPAVGGGAASETLASSLPGFDTTTNAISTTVITATGPSISTSTLSADGSGGAVAGGAGNIAIDASGNRGQPHGRGTVFDAWGGRESGPSITEGGPAVQRDASSSSGGGAAIGKGIEWWILGGALVVVVSGGAFVAYRVARK